MRKLKVTEMQRMNVDDFHSASKFPLVVVLDHVRSLYNVGSMFRTADAFRLSGLCLLSSGCTNKATACWLWSSVREAPCFRTSRQNPTSSMP